MQRRTGRSARTAPTSTVGTVTTMVTVAVGVLVAGCGTSGLETGAGTVQEKTAAAFVASVETDWRQEIDAGTSGAPSNLSPDARCYFVTADGKKSLGTMACGPVRRLGSGEGAVWDLVRIEATSGDDAGLRIPDGEQWQRSVARPAEGRLTRPDDKEPPADADRLALPPAPPAVSRLVMVQDQIGAADLAPHDEPLIVPDMTVTLAGLGAVDTIGTGSQAKSPAAGERFVVARLTTSETVDPLNGRPNEGAETSWAVTADSDARSVNLATDAAGDPQTQNVRGAQLYLIASVPKDAKEISLTATTAGVTQSLSLLTGKRTSTEVAAVYYRGRTAVALNKTLPAKTVQVGRDFDATYTITLTKAALVPWDRQKGWAPAGRAWFRFLFEDHSDTPIALYKITWNPSFFMVTADGRPVSMPPTGETRAGDAITAAVPAGVQTVRITATATLTFVEHSYSSSASPKSGSANFGTLTADATFG